ncbi:MAG: 16S rRNA (cytosine(1402)-N(4))-methyltransferase RsmH [Simkaniaceae bacterium]|nr:16S rRNA (cytosine(1402)-N(4))-methyltransferase RsmH [Candidatus Sacchlamyda saccharinae]
MQLDQREKGFSFSKEGPLDMRMDPSEELTASEIVNEWSEEELGEVFREFGEETRWRRAAQIIVEARAKGPIETTKQLADLLAGKLGRGFKKKLHPATLIFQGLRICVNRELESIQNALPKALEVLSFGGRIGVMSFHRLEDRIAKSIFKAGATVPAQNKYKEYVQKPTLKLLNKKPLEASDDEVRANPRARSAKLRFAEKMVH